MIIFSLLKSSLKTQFRSLKLKALHTTIFDPCQCVVINNMDGMIKLGA